MLHDICISAVVVSLRWASCSPWASCSYLFIKTCFGYSLNIFLISAWKCFLWYSLEAHHQGTSNEYPLRTFLWRNKKKYQHYLIGKKLIHVLQAVLIIHKEENTALRKICWIGEKWLIDSMKQCVGGWYFTVCQHLEAACYHLKMLVKNNLR